MLEGEIEFVSGSKGRDWRSLFPFFLDHSNATRAFFILAFVAGSGSQFRVAWTWQWKTVNGQRDPTKRWTSTPSIWDTMVTMLKHLDLQASSKDFFCFYIDYSKTRLIDTDRKSWPSNCTIVNHDLLDLLVMAPQFSSSGLRSFFPEHRLESVRLYASFWAQMAVSGKIVGGQFGWMSHHSASHFLSELWDFEILVPFHSFFWNLLWLSKMFSDHWERGSGWSGCPLAPIRQNLAVRSWKILSGRRLPPAFCSIGCRDVFFYPSSERVCLKIWYPPKFDCFVLFLMSAYIFPYFTPKIAICWERFQADPAPVTAGYATLRHADCRSLLQSLMGDGTQNFLEDWGLTHLRKSWPIYPLVI